MDSPFQHILHTNVVPTDEECDSIRAFLQGPRQKLADLREEIARLQALVEEVTRKREELEEFIDKHLALVSSFRRLPDDIVRVIFLETLPTARNPAFSADEAPLHLCQICKSWRTLALTTPPYGKLTAWLNRSGAVPLNISLIYSRTTDPTSDISSIVSPLFAISRRWRNIQLPLPSFPHFASLPSDEVPLLQSFSLTDRIERSLEDPPRPLMFLGTKSLESVAWGGPSHHLLDSPTSWGTLTSFTVSYPGIAYSDAIQILAQCPLLETCDIMLRVQTTQNSSLDSPPHQNICLPRLRHFYVRHYFMTDAVAARFFDGFVLPALRSFHTGSGYSLPADIPLRSLFPSTMVHLESLKVHLRKMASAVLLAALSDMPCLEDLHIIGEPCQAGPEHPRDPQFLVHLTPTPDGIDSVLCPRLRRLKLTQFKEASDDTLLEFILSRTEPRLDALRARTGQNIIPLSHFSCTIRRLMHRDVWPDLQNTECVVDLEYEPVRSISYSPLEGTD
ncbi:hypothetical protein B0H13DRAFT_1882693 [Mycena leptocephala]|nr:hypothetical protein B0H13DRAFT_1882693 [Mycena leptocephala]